MELLKFESRIGKVESGAEVVYDLICDMRNFKRFIPESSVKNWEATADTCSFDFPAAGSVNLNIVDREPFKMVKYSGKALNNTESFLWVQLKEVDSKDTRVKITLHASVNPTLKMLISKPINDFLEKLISGIENFDDWGEPVK